MAPNRLRNFHMSHPSFEGASKIINTRGRVSLFGERHNKSDRMQHAIQAILLHEKRACGRRPPAHPLKHIAGSDHYHIGKATLHIFRDKYGG